jgi:tetratricopeptide (TPR) repeat protein
LLRLTLSEPRLAEERALSLLSSDPTLEEASVAHQAMGIVRRDDGHTVEALGELETALRLAVRVGPSRRADVLATLGVTLVYAGATTQGLRRFTEAEALLTPTSLGRLLLRRGHALSVAGRYVQALADLDAAITNCNRQGDSVWEARGYNNRSVVHLALGNLREADADAGEAERMFLDLHQHYEAVQCAHNRAYAAERRGDLPAALSLMDWVAMRYRTLGVHSIDLDIDRAQLLLAAGLVGEALDLTRTTLSTVELPPAKRAELLLIAAQAALADGDLDTAYVDGDLAGRLFAKQHRPVWAHRATLLSLQARYLADPPDRRLLAPEPIEPDARQRRRRAGGLMRSATHLVAQMRAERAVDLAVALVLHGRIAHDAGRDDRAMESLEEAARARYSGSGLARAAGWLAEALLQDIRGDRRALLHACRQGLEAVDEHRILLGDLELRALATRHGIELAALAVRDAARRGRAREMLWWVERWRASALAVPRAHATKDPELDRQVAALRDVARRIGSAQDSALEGLLTERDRLEAQVRRTRRRQRSDGVRAEVFSLEGVLDVLDDSVLVVLMYLEGTLYAITAADGSVRRRVVGSITEAWQEARYSRFALRRAAFGRVPDVDAAAARLQRALLGHPAPEWSRPHVVVVPPADLLTAPWGLLPVFAETTLTVSPSATLWASARRRRNQQGHIALVTGPDLSTGEAEVIALSPLHDDAYSIAGDQATVAAAVRLLDGARLAHIAAHGTFRADAPLFSSLKLADGPLTVHDLDRLEQPPVEMVLSACDSGNAAPIGAHEALGLVSSLLAMGTSSVLASVVPVNDRATVGIMRHVHDVAGRGGSLADGWLAARQAAGDPLEQATAAAFTAWGA